MAGRLVSRPSCRMLQRQPSGSTWTLVARHPARDKECPLELRRPNLFPSSPSNLRVILSPGMRGDRKTHPKPDQPTSGRPVPCRLQVT